MNFQMKFWLQLLLAIIIGLIIGWVDSRPSWDDAGITALAILLATASLGAAIPTRAWVSGFAVGGSILILNVVLNRNYGAAVALIIAFTGAYAGAAIRKAFDFSMMSARDRQ
jgi:hypothetical protein